MEELFSGSLNTDNEVKAGDLLLAEPMLRDHNFQRTVILICEYHDEGSFGLVLNKQADVQIEELEAILPLEGNLYIGGPVQQNTLHFIHTFKALKGAIPLKNGVFWGGDYEVLKEKALLGELTPQNCRFFLGYSGWGEQQLKEELKQNSWVIASVDLSSIFDTPAEQLWEVVLKKLGGKYKLFVNYPIDPSLN